MTSEQKFAFPHYLNRFLCTWFVDNLLFILYSDWAGDGKIEEFGLELLFWTLSSYWAFPFSFSIPLPSSFFVFILYMMDEIQNNSLNYGYVPCSETLYCTWGTVVQFPAGIRDFSLLHSIQITSETHLASYPVNSRNHFPSSEVAVYEGDHSPPSSAGSPNYGLWATSCPRGDFIRPAKELCRNAPLELIFQWVLAKKHTSS
jgi:hypothetical protein